MSDGAAKSEITAHFEACEALGVTPEAILGWLERRSGRGWVPAPDVPIKRALGQAAAWLETLGVDIRPEPGFDEYHAADYWLRYEVLPRLPEDEDA